MGNALETKNVILLNAPVGSGKSPLAVTIARAFRDAYIITTQKSLQDQYAKDFKDIFIMKGKSNYPCSLDPSNGCDRGLCRTDKKLPCFIQKKSECPYYVELKKAMSAEIVLHNFSSFLYQAKYLPKYTQKRKVVIIDEAHNIEKILMNFVSFKISARAIEYIIPKKETIEEYIQVLRNI